MKKQILIILLCLIINIPTTEAQLSYNPWLDPNDEENIKEVYDKQLKKNNNNQANYIPQEHTTIERIEKTHVTKEKAQSSNNKSDSDFMQKISNMLSNDEKTTSQPKQKTGLWNKPTSRSSSGSLSTEAFSNKAKSAVNNFTRPISNGFTNLIKKFERASGVNLKSIARKL